jgi:transcriptional regulator with XRE-family HTH domain
MTGLTQGTVSRLESNERPARLRTVRKLADALRVEPRELMKREE